MTSYDSLDIDDWEFKIVRAATNKFRHPDVVRALSEEEAQSGWEMLEKFDDQRIRFKRRTSHRANDSRVEIDPYRTSYGLSSEALGLRVGIGILTTMVLIGGAAYLFMS